MASFAFWQKWLWAVGVAIAAFGVVMVFLSGTALFDVFNSQIDPVFWGSVGPDAASAGFRQWVYGVWGSTIAGWGVTIAYLAGNAFKKRERWAWNGIVAGLLVWYVLDTLVSVLSMVYFNVGFNTALLTLAGMPLVFTRKAFE